MAEATLPGGIVVVAGARPAATVVAPEAGGATYWLRKAREYSSFAFRASQFAFDRFSPVNYTPFREPTLSFAHLRALGDNLHVSTDFSIAAGHKSPGWNNVLFAYEAASRLYHQYLSRDAEHDHSLVDDRSVEDRARAFFTSAGFSMVRAFRDRGPAPDGSGTYDGLFLAKEVDGKVMVMAVHLGLNGNNDLNGVVGAAGRPHELGGKVHPVFHDEAKFAAVQLEQFMREVAARYPDKPIFLQNIGHSKGGGMTPEIERLVRHGLEARPLTTPDGVPIRVSHMPYVSGNGGPFGTEGWRQSVSHIAGFSIVARHDIVGAAQDMYNRAIFERGSLSPLGVLGSAMSWAGAMPEGAEPYSYPGIKILIESPKRWDEAHSPSTLARAAARWSIWKPADGTPVREPAGRPVVKEEGPRVSDAGVHPFGAMVAGISLARVEVDKRDLPDGALPTEIDGAPARQAAAQRAQEARVAHS